MKICYLDANVLIYFKDEGSDHHEEAADLLKTLLEKGFTFAISPLTLDEYLHFFWWALGKRQKEKAVYKRLSAMLDDILDLPDISLVNPPLSMEAQKQVPILMEQYGLKPRDAYHLLTALSEGIEYALTFDKDFEAVFDSGCIKNPI